MKQILFLSFIAVLLFSCKPNAKKVDSSETTTEETAKIEAVDYNGIYVGVLPCASCSGIKTYFDITDANAFTYKTIYIDGIDSLFSESGTYSVDKNLLEAKFKGGETRYFSIEEGQITCLNSEKQKSVGSMAHFYVLSKLTSITDNFIVTKDSISILNRDMSIEEINASLIDNKLKLEIGKGEFAEDSIKEYNLYDNNNVKLLSFVPRLVKEKLELVEQINIIDPRFKTPEGISIGSTFLDLKVSYKDIAVEPLVDFVLVNVKSLNISFSISKADLLEGWWVEATKSIDITKIPDSAKLVSFHVYANKK